MLNITTKIKDLAIQQGFDKVGITPAGTPEKAKFLEIWLKNEYHGEMAWMSNYKDKRMEVKKLFPYAKSVISVAYNYYTNFKHHSGQDYGKISRYAWGQDYHKIMKKKLKNLLQNIKEIEPQINGRICVDTAPIMEKLWAEKAGIGWQGKNTNIITRDYGSWVFLGELLVDCVLDYDMPISDFCGSCQACIQACPTNALLAPYQLDANKCISYLTIEHWDKPIPKELSKNMKGWIFGCDICQDVCPWNKYSKESSEPNFRPKEGNVYPVLSKWISMDESAYKKRFIKSAVLRTGFKNFIRNIKVNIPPKKDET
jgi:epoxyqueuosine reductase